ncbi:MAG: hydroxymethylglutaryl-CoA reductase [Candidatus Electrothrix sp. AR3]|nr:hydroxymethylglutaryl-CoA reductase [Candidatus Electrothrix sp. AR3]
MKSEPKVLPLIKNIHVPFKWVGPVLLKGDIENEYIDLPLATFEQPLWPSVNRGARVTGKSGGIRVTLIDDRMTRSILLQAPSAADALSLYNELKNNLEKLQSIVEKSSRFARLIDINSQIIGDLLYLRLEFTTGDAAGHNMVTHAADYILKYLLKSNKEFKHVSISGNYCTDKKVSAVNGILGRGKNVVAEVTVSRKLVQRYLKTSPELIVDLHIKKNLLGSIISGGIRTANAHAANMLLAFYLATGQDGANIVEGSQVINHCEIRNGDLYFSTTCPNLILGSVGNGKDLECARSVMHHIGCRKKGVEIGFNAKRLSLIAAGCVLCGELSLLAAQTNEGELMQSHLRLER